MLKRLLIPMAIFLIAGLAQAQQSDTLKAPAGDSAKVVPPPVAAPAEETGASKVYYGGYVGATFGDYSSIEVAPLVGYHFSPVLSGGLRFNYEYVWADLYGQDFNGSNYGGSTFLIARVHPKVYLQAEFQYMSYEYPTSLTATTREWVPFLYLGGGFVQPLSGNMSLVASVLVDVLQDDKSPYEDWSPMFSVGVVAGF